MVSPHWIEQTAVFVSIPGALTIREGRGHGTPSQRFRAPG